MTITKFEEIEAWQTARILTVRIYKLSETGKFAKDYGLRDQMRRAAVSVMSNIAEGFESKQNPCSLIIWAEPKLHLGSCELRHILL